MRQKERYCKASVEWRAKKEIRRKSRSVATERHTYRETHLQRHRHRHTGTGIDTDVARKEPVDMQTRKAASTDPATEIQIRAYSRYPHLLSLFSITLSR